MPNAQPSDPTDELPIIHRQLWFALVLYALTVRFTLIQ